MIRDCRDLFIVNNALNGEIDSKYNGQSHLYWYWYWYWSNGWKSDTLPRWYRAQMHYSLFSKGLTGGAPWLAHKGEVWGAFCEILGLAKFSILPLCCVQYHVIPNRNVIWECTVFGLKCFHRLVNDVFSALLIPCAVVYKNCLVKHHTNA